MQWLVADDSMDNKLPAKKILVLAANPQGLSSLRLEREVQEIGEGLQRSRQAVPFVLEHRWAVRPRDLRRALQEVQPQVVHFCGFGAQSVGLALEDINAQVQIIRSEALSALFGLFEDQIECVLLSGCYSDSQAETISKHIHYVIGIRPDVGAAAAIEFSVAFYDALGIGKSIEYAYRLGCSAIALAGVANHLMPVLRQKRASEPGNSTTSAVSTLPDSRSLPTIPSPVPTITTSKQAHVFISYRSQEPDASLAQAFYRGLQAAGHPAFMAGESIRLGENWSQRVDEELDKADYFLLLLSPLSATSEMVTEEVRRARELRDRRADHKPLILPIRVNLPWDAILNYDLRGYLNRIQQREWKTPEDTKNILQEILALLNPARQAELFQQSLSETKIEPPSVFSPPPSLNPPVPHAPPSPVAEPELPGGQVDMSSLFYVERPPVEANCEEAIALPGALIRIKAPRQMGKTSLLSRILQQAKELDHRTVPLSFQLADALVFTDLDKFLRWFCASVGRRLKLANRLSEYWDDIFGSKDNCTAYFEDYLLAEISNPLTLGLDEVDCVFQHPQIAADFLGLLRAWHENSKSRELWKKLRLVIVHSTEVYIPLNINQSPFNVGLPIELPEFTAAQVLDLAQRHGLNWVSDEVTQLMQVVGGHPYLVRVALYYITRGETTLKQLIESAPTEAGLYSDHLRRHLWNLEQRPELIHAIHKVMTSHEPVRLESVQAFQLHSMGLIHLQGNEVVPRCDLYRQYFYDRLGRST
ncbi:MAG: AAA-like domain-containing protein [Scytolyngbya sp. HA4215-MV1]|jgi:hypothetical protein|nr:AAA-like domain-containing protein [Scytolyngbya sp. HA4215-MV1]